MLTRWKFIEFYATMLLCYLSGLIDTTFIGFGTTQIPAYVGITNVFLLTLFIMATGPGSGGHVNPTITFATMVTGLTGFSRGTGLGDSAVMVGVDADGLFAGILYLIGQLAGAALAGGLLRGSFGEERSVKYASSLDFPSRKH